MSVRLRIRQREKTKTCQSRFSFARVARVARRVAVSRGAAPEHLNPPSSLATAWVRRRRASLAAAPGAVASNARDASRSTRSPPGAAAGSGSSRGGIGLKKARAEPRNRAAGDAPVQHDVGLGPVDGVVHPAAGLLHAETAPLSLMDKGRSDRQRSGSGGRVERTRRGRVRRREGFEKPALASKRCW